jgi:hypothetical protein
MFDFSDLYSLRPDEQDTYQQFEQAVARLDAAMGRDIGEVVGSPKVLEQVLAALQGAVDMNYRVGASQLLSRWRARRDGPDPWADAWAVDLLEGNGGVPRDIPDKEVGRIDIAAMPDVSRGGMLRSASKHPRGGEIWKGARRSLAAFFAGVLKAVKPEGYVPPAGGPDKKNPLASDKPDGVIEESRIWLKGQPYRFTHGLRPLLSYLLNNPGVHEEKVIRDCDMTDPSHLHKRLKDLRDRAEEELKRSSWRLQIKTEERCISCEWRQRG